MQNHLENGPWRYWRYFCCDNVKKKSVKKTKQVTGHRVLFCEISKLFYIDAVPIYIPTNSVQVFPFFHSLTNIYYLYSFWWKSLWQVWDNISLWLINQTEKEKYAILSLICRVRLRVSMHYSLPGSMEFSRQEYWSKLPFPTPGELPNPVIEPACLASSALAGRFFTSNATWEAHHVYVESQK